MIEKYGLFKRKRKKGIVWYFWYYSGQHRINKSTGQRNKYEAKIYAERFLKQKYSIKAKLSLGEFAEPYFDYERCPHVRRVLDDGRTITKRYAHLQRQTMMKYLFTDPIINMPISQIRRADIIDFRSRLIKKAGSRTVNRVIGILKIIFKEGIFREELDHDPTIGIGDIKYERKIRGTFTLEELRRLFPEDSHGPWSGLMDYTCFLLAASTGMRRGEILALPWRNVNLQDGFVIIDQAWKSENELGKPKWEHIRVTPFLIFKDQLINTLSELYEDSIRTNPDDLVFCYDSGDRLGDTWWTKHFNKALDRLGIDRRARLLSPHSFRHTLNTLLRDAGRDPAKIREVLGWRQERIQDNYTHFQIEHFKDLRLMD